MIFPQLRRKKATDSYTYRHYLVCFISSGKRKFSASENNLLSHNRALDLVPTLVTRAPRFRSHEKEFMPMNILFERFAGVRGVPALLVLSALILYSSFSSAQVVGQIDDFEDATTQGWREGGASGNPPTNALGGPDGVDDNYLSDDSDGSAFAGGKMAVFNTAQWTGDFMTPGITRIRAHARAVAGPTLNLRVGFQSGFRQLFVSSTAISVPNDGNWHEVTFPIESTDLSMVEGTSTYSQVMSAVNQMRFISRASLGWAGDQIVATMGLDNIQAMRPPAQDDFNDDGKSDILWRHSTTGQVYYWQQDGKTITTSASVATLNSLNWQVVGDSDYDGDGRSDIMWLNPVTGQIYFWRMSGATILSATPVSTLSDLNWSVIGDGDYNGDGKSDLMWRHGITGQIYYWEMNGATIESSAQVSILSDLDWKVIGDEDSDGDGKADLTWMHNTTGQVYFWKMNGATISSPAQIAIISDLNWKPVGDGDYNGDGNADLIWRHMISGKVYYWQMGGSTIQLSSRISIVGDPAWSIVGDGDYNGDGNADILWFNSATRQLFLWEQDGFTTVPAGQIAIVSDSNWQVVNAN